MRRIFRSQRSLGILWGNWDYKYVALKRGLGGGKAKTVNFSTIETRPAFAPHATIAASTASTVTEAMHATNSSRVPLMLPPS